MNIVASGGTAGDALHFSESPVNRLTRDELDPHSKNAPFKLTACRVEKQYFEKSA